MNLTTPFTLPFCTPPRAYTPSRCSCQRCKKDHQCPRPQLDGGDAHRAMLPDHARYPPQGRAARVRCTTKSIAKNSTTGSLPPAVPLAITPTFSPWTHTSDDSYIYQLSLVLATAIVSYLRAQRWCIVTWTSLLVHRIPLYPQHKHPLDRKYI